MKDRQIRQILQQTELATYINDPYSRVVPELKLPVAKARIDVAVINGHLHGYEIKSASDTLDRLPGQLIAYSKVFDYITIVTEGKYHERILNIIPAWVGVSVCSNEDGCNSIDVIQPPIFNTNKDGFFIAQLLWHSEILEILRAELISHKKDSRRWILCQTLTQNLDIYKLSHLVREKIKTRKEWKIKEGYSVM